jgi:nitrogen fixation protein
MAGSHSGQAIQHLHPFSNISQIRQSGQIAANRYKPVRWQGCGLQSGSMVTFHFRFSSLASSKHESGGTVQNNSASGDFNAGKPNQTQQDHQANLIVTIDWQDDENRDGLRPDQVKLSLLANGTVAARKAVTEKESWKCVFTGLPLRDKNNEPILYRVAENTIPGYSISQRKTEPAQSSSLLSCRNTSYIILNHREPSTTSVTVKTSWNDSMDHEKLRPKQTKVQLYANGIPYGGKRILDSSNGWKCHFKDLPVNTGGNRISYTAAQEWVPDGYQESLSADENGTILIENQHNAGESVSDDSSDMTSLSGYVKWDDADDQDSLRPFELEINLQANGKQIARKKVSAADGWTFSFDSLPKYTNGSEISYSVHASGHGTMLIIKRMSAFGRHPLFFFIIMHQPQ